MEGFADLHVHTTASDGTVSPEKIVELALQTDLKAIAITDHDAIEGIVPAIHSAKNLDCQVVPGVELSVTMNGIDMHLLGYYIDYTDSQFAKRLEFFRKVREERAEKIVQKLNELGIPIDFENVRKIAGEGSIGRPHIAEALLQEQFVTSFNEAFVRFLGYNNPAYVPKFKMSLAEAIDLVRSAGGISVYAHPGTVKKDELIPGFIAQGLQGLEVIHPDHNPSVTKHYTDVARKFGLIVTGGSDFHGPHTNMAAIGRFKVPMSWLKELENLRNNM
ncbi:MAG: PHP domain-containing protein [Gemmatimonadota bacterium]|nr:MAG: PHP domain-containing protein [Gemmatimonadota bacterium]